MYFFFFSFVFIAFIVLSVNLGQPALMAFAFLVACPLALCIFALLCVFHGVANKDACLL